MDEKRERQLERLKNWYKNLPEEKKEKRREQQREYRRKLREAIPDEVRAAKRLWRAHNQEHVNERQREYYKANPERWARYRANLDRDKARRQVRESYRRNHKEITWRRFQGVMSRDEFEGIYERVLKGPCEICGALPREGRVMDIDHDHVTMRFRGVLCIECNVTLARAEKNPKLRPRFADYLDRERGI
jgi:hypothetical protein